MTTIKATCPRCGEVDLTPEQVRLTVCTNAPASWPVPLSHYEFGCPGCRQQVRKPADAQVVSLLTGGGVPTTGWSLPEEATEAHHGPPLGYDDLLDFALRLGRSDHLAAAAAATAG